MITEEAYKDLMSIKIKDFQDYKYTPLQINVLYDTIPTPCQHCPNHIQNGGSGICHCILGGYHVTC